MLPIGTIVLWFGSLINIPLGWILCDGGGGSPDLRNKFIVGAGDTYAVDGTGGNAVHDHVFTSDGHFHTLGAGGAIGSGAIFADTTDVKTDGGTSEEGSTLPPYHALAYIMKT